MTGNPRGNSTIVLTTDFGSSDAYVGVMKGVILTINPNATIVDLTHEIGPQKVRQGAFVLGVNYSYFPPGAIHVAVVDPGVGTDRKPIVLETPSATFIAPDNGLLSEVVKEYLGVESSALGRPEAIPLPSPLMCWELSNTEYHRPPVSNTFHGRDIFAPAAAHLSLGLNPGDLGPALPELLYRPINWPTQLGDMLVGEVIYVDRFGNLVTNIRGEVLAYLGPFNSVAQVEIGERQIRGLSRTFHDASWEASSQPDALPVVALVGSNGYLEIAVRDGNAAAYLGASEGEQVRVSPGV